MTAQKGLLAAVCAGALLCAVRLSGEQAPMAVSPRRPANARVVARALPAAYSAAPVAAPLDLGPLSDAERRTRSLRGLRQTGVRRALPAETMASATAGVFAGRRAWRLTLRSESAAAVRVHFRQFSVGTGQVWLYAPPSGVTGAVRVAGPYSGKGPYGDGEFWSAGVASETVVVEYDDPNPANAAAAPPFTIDSVAHRWTAELLAASVPAPCELDVACSPAYANVASAVVEYEFASGGAFYDCSGSMINTLNSSLTPYMLTAHHCVGNDTDARTVQAFFLYQTASCNGTPPDLGSVPTVSGARFVSGAPIEQGDYSLLLLGGPAPTGVHFLGWNTAGPNVRDAVAGVHHPLGSWTRIAFGTRDPDETVSVSGSIAPANLFYQVNLTQGRIEPGSSGSPLVNTQGQIFGSLTAAPVIPPSETACDITPFQATYGRFSAAYPALQPFLSGESLPSVTATPASLSFTESDGALTGATSQTLTIQTTSTAALAFSAQAADSWVHLSTATGSVSSTAPATINVTVDPAAFSQPGTYTSSIGISAGIVAPVSIPVQLTVSATRSRIVASIDPNPVLQQTADAQGYSWFYTITLTETSGFPTRLTAVRFNGSDVTASILPLFGSGTIPAFGAISASVRSRGIVPPQTGVYEFSGADLTVGTPWMVTQSVTFLGPQAQAQLSLTSVPDPVRQNGTSCPWSQYVIVREQAGIAVNLTRFVAGGHDLSSQITGYFFGATQVPAGGSVLAGICWSSVAVPATLTTLVGGIDALGNSVTGTTQTDFLGPAVTSVPFNVTPRSVGMVSTDRVANGSANLTLTLGSNALAWKVEPVVPRGGSSWLAVYPQAGVGSGTVAVTANPSGLADGAYSARLLIEAVDATPQVYVVNVSFQVGNAVPSFPANGLVNAASYQRPAAPGMILSVFGVALASGIAQAAAMPLPATLLSTSATINGASAPLFYVSPGQVNLMIPFEAQAGTATVTLTAGGTSVSQSLAIGATAPGLFSMDESGGGQGAILIANTPTVAAPVGSVPNRDARPAQRGVDSVSIYCTGLGAVTNQPATGAAASANPLSRTTAAPTVTIGGVPAEVTYSGLAPGFAGLYQIDVLVPSAAAAGDAVPVVVVVIGGVASNTVTIAVR
jgi:uncharacterized protein (TIGR03437 family)